MATEKEMRSYLAKHGETAPKQLSQLKRVYGSHVSQTAMGLKFSRKQAYGHEKLPFKYEKRKGSKLAIFTGIFTIEQLIAFVNRSIMQYFTFRIYGILREGSPKRKAGELIDYSQPQWYSIGPVNRAFVEHAMHNQLDLTGFANEIDPGQINRFIDVFEIEILDTRSIRP